MVKIEELEKENQEMANLAAVLSALVDKPEFRHNPVFCELLQRFVDKVGAHLTHEARSVYTELLNHSDRKTNDIASQFISNTHELQKILASYTKRWCVAIPTKESHERFVDETNEVFRLLNDRINMEHTHLFPVLGNSAASH